MRCSIQDLLLKRHSSEHGPSKPHDTFRHNAVTTNLMLHVLRPPCLSTKHTIRLQKRNLTPSCINLVLTYEVI